MSNRDPDKGAVALEGRFTCWQRHPGDAAQCAPGHRAATRRHHHHRRVAADDLSQASHAVCARGRDRLELVSFSALLTAGHWRYRSPPSSKKAIASWRGSPATRSPDICSACPCCTRAAHGHPRIERVEGAEIERDGGREIIPYDAAIFSGEFQPETALLKGSHILLNPHSNGPAIDQFFRTSDPQIFAAGNLLRPVERRACAGRRPHCRGEHRRRSGRHATAAKFRRRRAGLEPVKYVYPQIIVPSAEAPCLCR